MFCVCITKVVLPDTAVGESLDIDACMSACPPCVCSNCAAAGPRETLMSSDRCISQAAVRRPAAALLGLPAFWISFKCRFITLLTNTRCFIDVFVLWLDWFSFESLFHAIIVSCGAVILHISAWERLGGKVKDFCAVYGGWDGSFPFEADKRHDLLWLLFSAPALMVWSNSFFIIIASW